jgi:hypothetical protein
MKRDQKDGKKKKKRGRNADDIPKSGDRERGWRSDSRSVKGQTTVAASLGLSDGDPRNKEMC